MNNCDVHGEECPSTDSPTCYKCNGTVHVDAGDDWECGLMCWRCTTEEYPIVLARAEAAEKRCKDLESELETAENLCKTLDAETAIYALGKIKLESERDRYKAALEFYAPMHGYCAGPDVDDLGSVAREALTAQPEGGPMGARDGSHDPSTTPMGTHTGESFNPAPPEYSVGFVSGEYEHLEREKARMLAAQDKPIECSYCGADFECPGCGRKTNQDK